MTQTTKTQMPNLRTEKHIERWERRKQMVNAYSQGYSFSDFADKVCEKFGVSYEALRSDWNRRKKWMPQLVQIDDKGMRVANLMLQIRAIQNEAWTAYRAAMANKNHNAAVGAIEKLIRIVKHEVEICQSLGILHAEATKIDALVTTTGALPWEEIPEVKEAVERIREQLRKQKEASDKKREELEKAAAKHVEPA